MSELNVHQRFASLWAWILVVIFSLALIGVIIYFFTQPNPHQRMNATRDTTIVPQETGGR